MHKITLGFLAIFALNFGCVKGHVTDIGEDPEPDPGVGAGNGGVINTKTDLDNCGTVGNACALRSEGACFEGYCRCIGDRDCHWPAACMDGICQAQNPSGATCWKDGDCEDKQYCIIGHCSPRACLSEVCDGYDNNCDGQTDEAIATTRSCYTGPSKTRDVGICKSGKQLCLDGHYTGCFDEVLPEKELGRFGCDGLDSDCDGCVDGTGNATIGCKGASPGFIDFTFFIDNSGSMIEEDAAVIRTVATFKQYKGDPRYRFSIVQTNSFEGPYFFKVIQPLTDFDTFIAALRAMPVPCDGCPRRCPRNIPDGIWHGIRCEAKPTSGSEMTYDSVHSVAMGDLDGEIKYRTGSKRVFILFTDEEGHTQGKPPVNEIDMCAAVDAGGVLLTVLTLPEFYPNWDLCAGKYLFPLSDNDVIMSSSLDGIFSLPCLN